MTISKIRIANFKSFADETVELNDFNLLVGANAFWQIKLCSGLQIPA